MPNTTKNCERGFTLVELLIAMALSLVVIASLSSAFISQRKTYAIQEQITEMTQGARAAMDMIGRELKMAGYNPMGPTGIAITGVQYNPVQLQIRADLKGDGDTSDPHEDVTYAYDSDNLLITRDTGSGKQPFAENIQSFTFKYFASDGVTEVTDA
ncbi:MAG: prepilin-type N-terminal cleavage/methylation domain-containing protein, partial [Deltaproteobacteria bacterium]|nr:prepilin-type N-terminal cleavage/methylation domain-containing protein [Deltaproteobacteria bacterium]